MTQTTPTEGRKVECLARATEMYFSAEERIYCDSMFLVLPNFWVWHPRGEKDAAICRRHRLIAMQMPGAAHLRERILAAERENL